MDERSTQAAADSFPRFFERLRAGDPRAESEVYRRHQTELLALAEARITPALQARLDAEGIVQSAFKSFWRGLRRDRLQLSGWAKIRGLLCRMVKCKLINQVKKLETQKRGGLEVLVPLQHNLSAGGAPPLDRMVIREAVERVHQRLTERERQVMALLAEEEEVAAIAARTGYTRRTVQRLRVKIGSLLERELYGS